MSGAMAYPGAMAYSARGTAALLETKEERASIHGFPETCSPQPRVQVGPFSSEGSKVRVVLEGILGVPKES